MKLAHKEQYENVFHLSFLGLFCYTCVGVIAVASLFGFPVYKRIDTQATILNFPITKRGAK